MTYGETTTSQIAMPLRLHNFFELNKLVEKNRASLSIDFPGVVERYSTTFGSLRSIRRAKANPDLKAYTIKNHVISDRRGVYVSTDPEEIPPAPISVDTTIIGLATMQLADIYVAGDGHTLIGVLAAGWLDEDWCGQGIGTDIANQLSTSAVDWARLHGGDIFTVIRPENEQAIHLAESCGLMAMGLAVDYSDQIGDGVEAARRVYALSQK